MTDLVFNSDATWALIQIVFWGFFVLPPAAVLLGLVLPDLVRPLWNLLLSQADWADRINGMLGTLTAWCALGLVLVQLAVVVLRYVFGVSLVELQEFILYLHAALFMMAGGYALLKDAHVRVDIFYRDAPTRTKAAINAAGVYLLLMPSMALMFYVAWPYVGASWEILEQSREASGLPVYPLKTMILIFALSLLMQGWALAARSLFTLAGAEPMRRQPA